MPIDLSRLVTADARAKATLAASKASALAQVGAAVEALSDAITGAVPLAEKLSWASKEAAARAVLANEATPSDAALIEGEAAVTGEPVAALVRRILANADSYRGIVAWLTGVRRGAEAEIAAADRPEVVEAAAMGALARLAARAGAMKG